MMNGLSGSLVNARRRSHCIEKNKWKVDDFMSFKRPNYMTRESSAHSESEPSEDERSQYSFKSSIDDELPELVVFLQETNYEFVKDICIDKTVTSLNICYEENCDVKNGSAPGFPKHSIVDSDSESTEESEDLETSDSSVESAEILEKDKNIVTEQQKVCSDAADELRSDLPKNKVVPKIPFLDREAAGKKTASSMSLRKLLDEYNRESNSERGSLFCHSKLSVSPNCGGGSSSRRADCQCCHECESTSTVENGALEEHTGEYRGHGFVYQHNQREISSNALDLDPVSIAVTKSSSYSGSLSLRSNSSSTNSSHSFAFPILQTEWNGSPERMLKANQMQPRRHQYWRMCFPCWKF